MIFHGHDYFISRVGKLHDTKVVYDLNNIVVLKVGTFDDCSRLFDKDSIHWCIAQSRRHWNEYVGSMFTRQYFIIDFNNINNPNSTEYNHSLIGYTVEKGKIMAAHARNDLDLRKSVTKYWGEELKTDMLFKFVLRDKGLSLYEFVFGKDRKEKESIMSGVFLTLFFVAVAVAIAIFGISHSKDSKKNNDPVVNLPKKENVIKIGIQEKQFLNCLDTFKLCEIPYEGVRFNTESSR